MNLRIGSRGSQLALWQANHIAALLCGEGHEVEIEIIKTTGDRLQEVTFAQVGAIQRECSPRRSRKRWPTGAWTWPFIRSKICPPSCRSRLRWRRRLRAWTRATSSFR
jgi:hypothetical protein